MKKHTHFNHILLLAFMALFFATDAKAVLKEENLERTLFILHNELNVQYKEQATRAAIQKRRREDMKNRIIEVWRKSNQNALMLYSQKQDYVFDLTYACHEATQQYQEFTRGSVPCNTFLSRIKIDIARYDSLTKSLKKMPSHLLSKKARADRDACLHLSMEISKTLRENYKNTNEFIRLYADKFFEIVDKTYAQIYGTVPFTENMKWNGSFPERYSIMESSLWEAPEAHPAISIIPL